MNKPSPSQFHFIGVPLVRKEDARLVTGTGRFSDDFSAADQCHLVVVRSPHPHARIWGIDFSAARGMPGVLGTFSGADCPADGQHPIPHNPVPKTRYDMKLHAPGGGTVFIGPHMLLPTDKARHVGEAVAAVVARDAGAGARRRRGRCRLLRGTAVCASVGRRDAARRACGVG